MEIIDIYSSLGMFVPQRARKFTPYAERAAYAGSGRHHAKISRSRSWGDFRKAAVSLLRDAGDTLFGAFLAPTLA